MIDLSRISRNEKFFFLAYDQGMEHGPKDLNLTTCNPEYVLNLTKSGLFTAFICHKGIAEKYYHPDQYKTPLIIKLNGKSSFINDEPYSPQICSVEEAVRLRAKAVGYTVYVGSRHEDKMFREFSTIVCEAHDIGIPVIGWMYPRGGNVGQETTDITAYAARIGMELGADIVKVRYAGDPTSMQWVTSCAGAAKVCIAGGAHLDHAGLIDEITGAMASGCVGGAIGRNVWQDPEPLRKAKEIADIIFEN